MRLQKLFSQQQDPPAFQRYLTGFKPPLDLSRLSLNRAVVGIDPLPIVVDTGVVGVLQLMYKGGAGAALGIAEEDDGEIWNIPQVQGAQGGKAYRIASGIHGNRLLADETLRCANTDGAIVRQITMPPIHRITNIDGARSENVTGHYRAVQIALGMQWSDAESRYLVDLKK